LGFLDHEEEVYAKQFKGISKKKKKTFLWIFTAWRE